MVEINLLCPVQKVYPGNVVTKAEKSQFVHCLALIMCVSFIKTLRVAFKDIYSLWGINVIGIQLSYSPGINNKGEMKIVCDRSCSSTKKDAGFQLITPDKVNLSDHAYKHHLEQLKGYPCIEGRTSVEEITNPIVSRYVLESLESPPVLVNGTKETLDIKFTNKRRLTMQTEDANNINGGLEVGTSVGVKGGKSNLKRRQHSFEDIEETMKIGAHENYILKQESYDIHIKHPTNEIKRSISCSEVLIFFFQDGELIARPAVSEETAYHFWRSLEPHQRSIFEDVRYFRIWLPTSGKFLTDDCELRSRHMKPMV